MKNKLKTFGALSLSLIAATSLASCRGGRDKIDNDPKTINVRLFKRGFGEDFIYDLRDQFESLYAAEGYKMNILTPSPDNGGIQMVQEMSSGRGIDLYVIGNVNPDMVSDAGEYGEVAEDIEELVYNQTSIDYQGNEGKTIKELINPDIEQFLRADNGKMYGFAWAQASAGLVINSKKLAKFGINEVPRTTKEFMTACQKIYEKYDGNKNTTRPLTYTISNSSYSDCAFQQWFAQLGIDKFNEYCRFQNKTETGWTDMTSIDAVFNDEDLYESIVEAYRFMDPYLAAKGSVSQDLDQAQQKLIDNGGKDDAVFMFNGDWFLNEIKENFPNLLDQFAFANIPVISKLGEKIFCNAPYNKTEDGADELLSFACKLVDENKTEQEIKTAFKSEKNVELSDEDLKTLCDARGLSYARGPEHLAFIPKASEKKDISALALRMMASNDFAQTFMDTANCSTPYAVDVVVPGSNKFIQDAKDICSNTYYRAIRALARGKRTRVGMGTFYPGCNLLSQEIGTLANPVTIYDGKGGYNGNTDSVYQEAARKFFNKMKTNALETWATKNK